jgi:hypothetical protein
MSAPTQIRRFNCFPQDLCCGVHNLRDDVLKVALADVEPNLVADQLLDDIGEIDPGYGYDPGGMIAVQSRTKQPIGGFELALSAVVFKAYGGIIGPFRHIVLYNATAVRNAAGKEGHPLIASWNYRDSIHLEDGETFTWRIKDAAPVFRLG